MMLRLQCSRGVLLSVCDLLPPACLLLSHRYEAYSQRIAAALQQQPGQPVPLEELVVILFAIQNDLADGIQPKDVPALLAEGLDSLRKDNAKVLTDIAASKQLTAASEKGIVQVFQALQKQRGAR